MAQFDYLVNLPENVASLGLLNVSGQTMGSLGEVVNNAMELVEQQSDQLTGVLLKATLISRMSFLVSCSESLITMHWMKWVEM